MIAPRVGGGGGSVGRFARRRTWRSVAAMRRRRGYRGPFVPPERFPATSTLGFMASIHSSSLPNGLPIHRVEIPGTRAITVLVAFDAGARTERPEENGMAHFLEHLVFKGGQKYDDYRKVNET